MEVAKKKLISPKQYFDVLSKDFYRYLIAQNNVLERDYFVLLCWNNKRDNENVYLTIMKRM